MVEKTENLQDIIVEMYEIAIFKCIFNQIEYIFFLKILRCVHLGKSLRLKNYFFPFGYSMKKIIIVKVGFCKAFGINNVLNTILIFIKSNEVVG
jgi:hypothetical protein